MTDEQPPLTPEERLAREPRHSRTEDPNEPREPLWMDLRPFGPRWPTNRALIRGFIIAVVVSAVIFGWVVYQAYQGVQAQHADIRQGRTQRLANQKLVNEEIAQLKQAIADNKQGTRDLACSVVIYLQHVPIAPGTRRPEGFIQFLSDKYNCAHYTPAPVPTAGTTSAARGSTHQAQPAPSPGVRTVTAHSTQVATHVRIEPRSGPTVTRVRTTTPRPPHTSPTPSPSPTHTPILCVPGLICLG